MSMSSTEGISWHVETKAVYKVAHNPREHNMFQPFRDEMPVFLPTQGFLNKLMVPQVPVGQGMLWESVPVSGPCEDATSYDRIRGRGQLGMHLPFRKRRGGASLQMRDA